VPSPELRVDAKLFSGYDGAAGSYDEVFAAPGELRPAWRRLVDASQGLSRAEFGRRWQQAQRLLHENSLAYPDPNDPSARRHPWALDALPLVIDAAEWRVLAAALKQRATLLDLVLRDIYGPRQLFRTGVLPAEVVFRHPGFLLPYCETEGKPGRMLHLYAADLARAPDGKWRVLDDRCESPSGAGFALQNRIAMSRMLPDVFHDCRVERLAPYFIAVQEQLRRRASPQDRRPRIVLLSHQAGSANYFEDAFLARYLGYTLAEAGDLAVRQNQLFLKSLAGLSPVDVLLRRPNSENCDPLELTETSTSGVAGLMQTIRAGNVAVANSLGSGLVESPVFMAYLPRLAEELLGKPLAMPNVDTWWCGDAESRRYVVSRIGELTIKHAFRQRGRRESNFSGFTHAELIARIEADPTAYVAQERVIRSTAPVWSDEQVERSYISLRTFAAAAGDDDYVVMPGGLTRVSTSLAPLELSLLDGERSKDAWVLSDNPVPSVTLLVSQDEPLELRRGGVDLPSRAAENFFWLGRNAVRAESLAKLVRAVAVRLTSEEDAHRIPELPLLLRVLAELGQIEPGYVVDEIKLRLPALERLLPAAVFDDTQPGTLRSTVGAIARLAATVRDLLSLDTWRIIRQMDEGFRPATAEDGFLDMLVKLEALLVNLAAYTGHVAEGMTRTHAWRFLDLGRRLERTLQTSQLIRAVITGGGAAAAALQALLEISDSLMTYRSRYFSRFQLGAVLDLLVTDESNPRSIAYQLVKCAAHAAQLPIEAVPIGRRAEEQLTMSLLQLVRRADCAELARAYLSGDVEPLEGLLSGIDSTMPKLSDAVSHRYFFHSGAAQRLAQS
jgi:uncharacterized circularly permuted ATP-grasp superfamily protein/uncharacterized alpha-E superfamily protein